MDKVNDYIMVINSIPKELCESLIDECNKKQWKKHTWNNYAEGTFSSEPTKELDVMPCTQEQQNKITPHLIKALEAYQQKFSKPGQKTNPPWLTKFSPIRFNKYPIGTMMREQNDEAKKQSKINKEEAAGIWSKVLAAFVAMLDPKMFIYRLPTDGK